MDNNLDLLSKQQQAIWISLQLHPESAMFNATTFFEIKGKIDVKRLEESVQNVMASADILETVSHFLREEKVTHQNFTPFTVLLADNVNIKEWAAAPLKLENKLAEFLIIPKNEELTHFYAKWHHIIFDGYSKKLFLDKVVEFYTDSTSNFANFSYQEYLDDEKAYFNSDDYRIDKNYWQEKLSRIEFSDKGFSSFFTIHTSNQGGKSNREVIVIPRKVYDEIALFCEENQVTIFYYFIATILILNKKYNAPDFLFGLALFNRRNEYFRKTAGMFVDSIPFHQEINANDTFLSLTKKIKQNLKKDYAHKRLPIFDLSHNFDKNILTNIVFSYQKFQFEPKLGNSSISAIYLPPTEQEVDLAFQLMEYSDKDDVIFALDYKSSSISSSEIEMFSRHLYNLIRNSKNSFDLPISDLSYLSKNEEQQLLSEFNDTATDYPKDKTIVELFEEQAERAPDRIAVVYEQNELTFGELNEKSNQLADYLRQTYSIQADDLIVIMLERSEWMIVAIMGALKSGGAYVPIDKDNPQERIDYMLENSGAKVVIDQQELDQFIRFQERYTTTNLEIRTTTNHLAYVIYTSGTTGNPKGVMVEHVSLVNLVSSFTNINQDSVITSMVNTSFDAFVQHLFCSLVKGARFIFVAQMDLLNPKQLEAIIKKEHVTHLYATPNYLSELEGLRGTDLKFVTVGGGVLNKSLAEKYNKDFTFLNEYGPTENTVTTLIYQVPHPLKHAAIPIGKPISNNAIYILGELGNLLPIGVAGEIFISGDSLARGYLNDPELTAEKFVPNPFVPGERMYKTGDLGRWLPDGNIDFIGRIDDQVKIRGYRIELGAIERVLNQYDAVQECVVLAKEISGNKKLVAYLSLNEELNTRALETHIKSSLPEYMVPGYFVQLEEFPLTPNGKIDKKSLPDPDASHNASAYIAPRTEIERSIATIWSEILELNKEEIGIHNDFFELGGHSLKATKVVSRISKDLSVQLSIKDVFTYKILAELADFIEESDASVYEAIPLVATQESYELSSSQQRLWILSQFEQGNSAYNMPGLFELTGPLDIGLFKTAINNLIARHESLRTVFKEDRAGNVRQWILPEDNHHFKCNYLDLRSDNNQEETLKSLASKELQYGFDLERDSLIRATLIQRTNNSYVFVFVMHHIIGDGWSINVLIRDLLAFYNGLINKTEVSLPPLRIQYKDYAAWQQDKIKQEKDIIASKSFWLNQFSGELPVLNMPLDKTRPAVQSFNGARIAFALTEGITKTLKTINQETGASLFMSLVANVNVLLHKYTGQTDIILGSPLASRDHLDLNDQIGFYINTLALRTTFSSSDSFNDLLESVKVKTLQAYEHHQYPFDELVGELNLQRDVSRNPLFDVMVVLQNNERIDFSQDAGGIELKPFKNKGASVISKFDLTFSFTEINNEITIDIVYNSDLFENGTIERLGNHLIQLIEATVHHPNLPLSELSYLTDQSTRQLLVEFNDTVTDFPKDKTIIQLFEEQVEQTPDHVAIVFEDKELTYKTLNEYTNQLGDYLRRTYTIQPDDLVAIKLERSEWIIIAILGVLKSGGAYVPIDPENPVERIEFMVDDSKAKVLIDQKELDKFIESRVDYTTTNLEIKTRVNDLAYVIYTSGTTGKPKGVMIENKSLVNLVASFNYIDKDSVITSMVNTSFDAFVEQLFSIITRGATFIFVSKERLLNPSEFEEIIRNHQVTHLFVMPNYLQELKGLRDTNLKMIIVGGVVLNKKLAAEYSNDFIFLNEYGPTENTVTTLTFRVPHPIEHSVIPIGKPIANNRVYVLDDQENLLPIGVVGEISIAGEGLARGYLNRPELTAEKFVPNPFEEGTRMYKTGDLGRWLPDGNIEFVGRKDDQVKLRGYRIELGEIERVLNQYKPIQESVVLIKEDESGHKQLVAYVSSEGEQIVRDLQAHLKRSLPDYMVPDVFVQLEEFPVTPNGKIDKKSLPDPSSLNGAFSSLSASVYVAPRTEIERQLVDIWSDILELTAEEIGVHDDFFAIGGHSLKATKVVSRISRDLSVQLSINDVFTYKTIEELADVVKQTVSSIFEAIPVLDAQENYVLTSAQRRLWVLSQFERSKHAYNMPGVFEMDGILDIELFNASFHLLIARHEVLRTVFKKDGAGEVKQWILPENNHLFKFNYQDIRGDNDKEEIIKSLVNQEIQYVFDLEKDSLFRVTLIQRSNSSYVFVFVMHHIISDGWSINVLVRDLLGYYNGLKNKTEVSLPALRIQYKDFAAWHQNEIQEENETLIASKTFWLNQFSGALPVLNMPLDNVRPAVQTFNGDQVNLVLNAATTKKLKTITRDKGATLFMSLLASVNVLLHKYTGQTDIILGSPLAGRDHIDLNDQIGFYLKTLALRTSFNSSDSFSDLVNLVKSNTLKAYEHQNYPFDDLVDELSLQRDVSRNPLFDVMIVLQNNDLGDFSRGFEGLELKPSNFQKESDISKFELTFNFRESGEEVALGIIYNSDLFKKDTVERLANHLNQLIEFFVDHPTQPLSEISCLSTTEKHQLLVEFNDTKADYPKDKTIVELFEEQVQRTPDQVAIVFGDKKLTYTTINEHANQLGDYLRKTHGIQPEDSVGLLLERSEWMVLAIWGVLKSGGAYVPIDPRYPQERIDYILKDAKAKVLIDQNELNKFFSSSDDYNKNNLKLLSNSSSLAYTYYTSGSTGRPKGVLAEHRNVISFFSNIQTTLDIPPGSNFLGITNYTFDPAVLEYIGSLINGIQVEIVADYLPETIYHALATNQPNILQTTPARLLQLIDYNPEVIPLLAKLDTLLIGGEAFPERLLSSLDQLDNTRILNIYGPTETTLWSTSYEVVKGKKITVGTPLNNDSVYILDKENNLLPIGVIGEICISGDGVARGYLNRPELTAEKFIPNPFKEGTRLYKSGDLGKWLPDGSIEFIGRNDHQVKIRGHRIELGEIEGVLYQFEGLKECAVVAKGVEAGDKYLIAYLQSPNQLNVNDIRAHLKGSLPDYMIPTYFVQLEKFPLTPNGKLDKKALPDPGSSDDSCEFVRLSGTSTYEAPRTDTERKIIAIWSEILEVKEEEIGIHDDFFVLGGHSLKATKVLGRISKELSVQLSIEDVFTNATTKELAILIKNTETSTYKAIPVLAPQKNYQLSSAQRRLWILSQFEHGNYAYNMPGVFEVDGDLDIELFKASFHQLIARHESLRTVFKKDEEDNIRQWILPEEDHNFKFNYKDLRNQNNQEKILNTVVSKELKHVFDLEKDSLLRATVVQRTRNRFTFVFVMHHIISDGWSINVLVRDLLTYYNGLKNNTEVTLPPLRIQYKDYAAWQQNNMQQENEDLIASKTFWLNQFRGELPVLNLPMDEVRPAVQTFNGNQFKFTIPSTNTNKLKTIAQEQGATLFMNLLASVNALLHKYTGQTDIIVGSPLAGRDHIDLNDQLGFYVNTLALRTTFSPSDSYNDLVQLIKVNTLKAYEHQNYPFDDLVDELNLQRDTSRNPLFDVMVILHNNDQANFHQGFEGLEMRPYTNQDGVISQFDLTFNFAEINNELVVGIVYNHDLFKKGTIERLGTHLSQLINALIENPDQPLADVTFLDDNSTQQLLVEFNNTSTDYPADKSIIELFEEQVVRTPDNIAVVFEGTALTYKALNEKANQLGDYLRQSYRIHPDDLVAIQLDRSEWMIIAILGVLKSGAAYLPIDPEYPQERIDYMLSDSKSKALIDQEELNRFIDLDKEYSKSNLTITTTADHLAYVIYTSGSTGKPKGVEQLNSTVTNLVHHSYSIDNIEFDRLLQFASFSFDVSIQEVMTCLLRGSQLFIASSDLKFNTADLFSYLDKNRIDAIYLPTSYFTKVFLEDFLMVNDPLSLNHIIVAGEKLTIPSISITKLNRKGITLHDHYGPTETHVITSTIYSPNSEWRNNTIGVPISNTNIYILDDHQHLLPIGIVGEICASGDGVARGYLNRPELTAEKFVPNPFAEGNMYKTGDLGRWLPDGSIQYIGRKDEQLKIRGYRIEVAEIESTLHQYDDIHECTVLARESEAGDKHLIAYLQASKELNTSAIRTHLKDRLPDYMVPSYFVQLEEFPLTPNGKLDKKLLPEPSSNGGFSNQSDASIYVPPTTDTGRTLVKIWSEILEIKAEEISIHDDFFALGGHSLRATKVISKASKELSVKLSIKDVFHNPTIKELVDLINNTDKSIYKGIPLLDTQESYVLSSAQRRIWILSQFESGNYAYNMSGVFEFDGALDIDLFEAAFHQLIARHESLRTVFKEDGTGNLRQWILPEDDHHFKFNYQDLSHDNHQEETIHKVISEELQYVFDFEQDSLLKAALVQKSSNSYVFIIILHHIVSDGWSINILIRDLLAFYNGLKNNTPVALPTLRIQYKDYAAWQQDKIQDGNEKLVSSKAYWLNQFSGDLPVLNMPLDKVRPAVQSFNGGLVNLVIEEKLTRKFKSIAQENGTTLFMSLLASVNVLLYKYTGQTDIILGSPLAGRDHTDLNDQIGFYINTLALRTTFNSFDSFSDLLKSIKENTLKAYEHQHYPFDALVDELNLQRDTSRNPLFDVMVALQNNEHTDLNHGFEELEVQPYNNQALSVISKFDLIFNFTEIDDEIVANIEFNSDLFNKDTIERLSTHLTQLLEALADNPTQPLSEIKYLSNKSTQQLLVEFNNTSTDYPADKPLIQLFEEQVIQTPDEVALVFEDKELSYSALNEWANQLGDYLRQTYHIQPNDLVAIQLDRSEWMIIAILGVLKSGGAYVPIDPEYPKERIDYMLQDSNAKALIDQEELNKFTHLATEYTKTNLEQTSRPNDLAYVIYTSGSTGKPKAVEQLNATISNLVHHTQAVDNIEFNRLLQFASFSFDVSIQEIMSCLLVGSRLYIASADLKFNTTALFSYLNENSIDAIYLPTSYFTKVFIDDFLVSNTPVSLNHIIVAGEKLTITGQSISALNAKGITLHDQYGPTETHVVTTKIYSPNEKTINNSIGLPISNTNIYIVDEMENLLPIGVVGEICVSGNGVARGYLNRPELTAAKFVPNPFDEGKNMYKTGDLGKWLPDGHIQYIGRKDNQLKIRGYRIEVGEIENALHLHEDVRECTVLARESEAGDKHLIAYLQSPIALNTNEIRSYLKGSLPDYMVPSYFVQLEEFPLTQNGKLDKKSLPNPENLGLDTGLEYVAPTSQIERTLVSIWSEILEIKEEEIGIHHDFFTLGGHSLKATKVISRISKELSVQLSINDLFTNTTIKELEDVIQYSDTSIYKAIPFLAVQESYELSSAQRRLWILSQFDHGSYAYNMSGVFELDGDLDIELLKTSFHHLITRHESLRTIFKENEEGEIRQWILPEDGHHFKFNYQDIRHQNKQEKTIKTILSRELQFVFDLENDSLLRATVIQQSDNKYVFACVMHHIVSDGWSLNVLVRDLLAYYNGLKNKTKVALPPLRIQYKDYAAWQQNIIQHENLVASKNFWLNQFKGDLPVLNIPLDKIRPADQTFNGGKINFVIKEARTKKIKTITREKGASLFMSLLASVNVLLHKYTGQTDIILGSPLAGRDHLDLNDQLGFYINTLALRTTFNSSDSFSNLVDSIREHTLKAYEHQNYPFDELVEELNVQRDRSRNPLFDVMVILQNNERTDLNHGFEGLEVSPYKRDETVISKFDLSFNFIEINSEIAVDIVYNSDLFKHDTIQRLGNHLHQLIHVLIDNPNQPISGLSYLSDKSRHQLLVEFNDSTTDYPTDKTIIQLFEEQVERTPDHVAVVFEGKEYSYIALNEHANQLGDYLLQTYNVQPDDLVAIQLDRSEWIIIAILGVLKSGAAYVPIDPENPADRIEFMLQDSNAKAVINQRELDKFIKTKEDFTTTNLETSARNNHLAYVIYTSGTTGKPKGVMIENKSLVNLASSFNYINKESVITSMVNTSFDAFVEQLFSVVTRGATFIFVSKERLLNPSAFEEIIRNHQVTHLFVMPTYLQELTDLRDTNLEMITVGGVVLNKNLAELYCNDFIFLNEYGPTENTVTTLTFKVPYPVEHVVIPIGKPISNNRVYILDDQENLLPIGVVGEISIAGDGLARGYLNRPELTAEKFVPNPFEEGKKMYKTGDLGKWLPDGNIEFIGRKDDQVKIRGYRIELGEIERVLNQYEPIQECTVLVKEDVSNNKILVAYVCSDEEQNTQVLRTHLKRSLPEYMVPDAFVQLEKLPVTANGKLDKKALPNPEDSSMSASIYVAPATELEKALVNIWSEILDLNEDSIGVYDDFFAIGGHSLKATKVVSKLSKELSVQLTIKDLFAYTTIKELVEVINRSDTTTHEAIPVLAAQENYPLSSAQRRLWVVSLFDQGNFAYNMPGVLELEGELDIELFRTSFNNIIARHESLRTVFKEDDEGNVRQWILPEDNHHFKLNYLDLRNHSNHQEKRIQELVTKELQHVFDLGNDSLLRATILQRSNNSFVFIFILHHIISDGWSINILIRDLMMNYNALKNKTQVILPALRIQYKDYAAWQQNTMQQEQHDLLSSKNYWLNQFSGNLSVLNMPLDKVRPAVKTFNGSSINFIINRELTEKIQTITRETGATLFMSLLASVNALLYKYTSQTDITLGSPLAGRDHIDLNDQLGFYINTVALRTLFSSTTSFSKLVELIKGNTLMAYEHQNYPFEDIVDELNLKRDRSRNPLFDVMIVLQNNNQTDINQGFDGLEIKLYENQESVTSKFDLTFNFNEIHDQIVVNIEYNTDLFKKETIERLGNHFNLLTEALIDNPDQPLSEITYLNNQSIQQLLVEFNDTTTYYPEDKTIIQLFEEQVEQTPEHIALIFEDKALTYRELNTRANQLGEYLRQIYNIQPDDLVAIKLDRSEWMVIAILGVLKSGGAYVPIDPEYPQERIDYMLEDSNAKAIIDQKELTKFVSIQKEFSQHNPDASCAPNHLAYVIYTSGSTGKPKGVEQLNSTVTNLVHHSYTKDKIKFERLLQFASFSFDVSIQEVMTCLITGARLYIASTDLKFDTTDLFFYLDQHKIDAIYLPTSYFSKVFIDEFLVAEASFSLNHIIVAGEKLTIDTKLVSKLNRKGITLHDHYGPTETHVVTTKQYSPDSGLINNTIGSPISNTSIYILDETENLLPIGVVGEICITGDGVARGYLNRPELTAEKFVPNPFVDGKNMYKTGDLGRWLSDGTIQYIGRKDDQLKIRGYRIEVGEIESALRLNNDIQECAVLARDSETGDKYLVAYYQSSKELDTNEIRTHLKGNLPDYMMPGYFVQLAEFPLTANGKLDRNALPKPDSSNLNDASEYVAPNNETEKKLVKIWSEVLGIEEEKIGIHDDFFDLGGHSLKATVVITKISKEFSVKLKINYLFTMTTITEIADIIESLKKVSSTPNENHSNTLIF